MVIATSEPSHVDGDMAQVGGLIDSRTIQRMLTTWRITSEVNLDGELIRARGDTSETFPLQYLDSHTRSAVFKKADRFEPAVADSSSAKSLNYTSIQWLL